MNSPPLSRCTATSRKFSVSRCSTSRKPPKRERRCEPPPRQAPSLPSATSLSERSLRAQKVNRAYLHTCARVSLNKAQGIFIPGGVFFEKREQGKGRGRWFWPRRGRAAIVINEKLRRTRGAGVMRIKFLPVCGVAFLAVACSRKGASPEPGTPAGNRAAAHVEESPGPPVVALRTGSYAYPLKVSANGRYLVDQNNKPFRIQGDSAQSLIANLTYAEADKYLSDRQRKGFNTININLLEAKFAIHAPANRNGDTPFTKPGDFSTPNEAYFAFADSIIDLAASKGMLVSLAAMYLGDNGGDQGWWTVVTNGVNTQTVCYNFGLYLGKRYKSRKNILWVIGGDYLPPEGSEGEARLRRLMEGIRDAGAKQLWAGDWKAPCISTDEKGLAFLMDVNAVYTYGIPEHPGTTYGEARTAYNDSTPRPAYLKEVGYEDENWIAGDPASVRKYEYWGILGGATAGAFFGNRDIWEFATASWWSGFTF